MYGGCLHGQQDLLWENTSRDTRAARTTRKEFLDIQVNYYSECCKFTLKLVHNVCDMIKTCSVSELFVFLRKKFVLQVNQSNRYELLYTNCIYTLLATLYTTYN